MSFCLSEIGGLLCTGFIPAQTLILVLNVPDSVYIIVFHCVAIY